MLEQHVKNFFGFDSFKTGQKAVITSLLNHHSAAAIFPTGAGKSLCYQLPALLLPHLTLVVSPLLSLMKDQIDFLKEKNIPAARLDSTLSKGEYDNILSKAKNGRLKILMISVERFRNERFRHHLRNSKISLLVIDEAHCISEWGHNFRPDYLKLPGYQSDFQIDQVLLLTATATGKVIDDMCSKFSLPREHVTITGFYRENLNLSVIPVAETDKSRTLVQSFLQSPSSPTIVYVTLQKTAENVADLLKANGINASAYHAGMKSEIREVTQNQFMNNQLDCVVATIAFGMGIDKKDIRRVIHYDFPKSIENYSQEIGRSGRDGHTSYCQVLANKDHLHTLENFVYGDTPERNALARLLSMIKRSEGVNWEAKLITLSNELNIRPLPLKTLLVYLEIEGIIKPKYTYFGDYYFKYIMEPSGIINQFQGERRHFVQSVIHHCLRKKVWTYVNMDGLLGGAQYPRQRIIAALEYFDQKGWIVLQSKNAIDVYDISNHSFDIESLSAKMTTLFKSKEAIEIQRIHHMVTFFESEQCINFNLARYFGESISKTSCGHCSFCETGKIKIPHSTRLKPLSQYHYQDLTGKFKFSLQKEFSILNLTKFLCGIHTPLFTRYKVKSIPTFGVLEQYPFHDVKKWVTQNEGK